MITQLRQASAQVVSTMQSGAQRTHDAVQQIAGAAQQQSHVTQEINELAVRIHTASEEGARDASALRELGQSMLAISQRLAGMSR